MPIPTPTHLPTDFDSFALPPSVFELVTQELGLLPAPVDLSAWLARAQPQSGASASSHTAQADGPPAQPWRPGEWSSDPAEVAYRERPASADPRLSAIESWDPIPTDHIWTRQELHAMDDNGTPQAAGQQSPAAQPGHLARLLAFGQTLDRPVEPGGTHTDHAAAAAEEEVDSMAAWAPGTPDTLDSPDAALAPFAGIVGAMVLAAVIGMHPAGDCHGM